MSEYKCFKYHPSEGKVWSIVFKHPLRLDSSGNKGRWTRRSLETKDSKIADNLINEMKEILSNEHFWNEKSKIENKFKPIIISAFYDSINSQVFDEDTISIRENLLPLPSTYDGYNKVLFVGTTGSGKTTLLRHLIDTYPDNFPLTTTAKATVSDLEIIVADGTYKAVVTFFNKNKINSFVRECVFYALIDAMKVNDKKKISQSFFVNKEQTFRLNYIIGGYSLDKKLIDDENEDENNADTDIGDYIDVDKETITNNVNQYLETIIKLATTFNKTIKNDESKYFINNDYTEEFEQLIYENSEFNKLIKEIMIDITKRFGLIKKGFVNHSNDDWPIYWEFETHDRLEFLKSLRIFSSNYYKMFGQLLTPAVQGMRIQGPFYPKSLTNEKPKLVYIDGQGLGHIASSAQAHSIPKKLDNMFENVDIIMLLDNAKQPMQSSSIITLKRVIASGYKDKLAIVFTHFDLVDGINFESRDDKIDHVYDSVTNAISTFKEDIGLFTVNNLEHEFKKDCFFLEKLNEKTVNLNKFTKKQLNNLLKLLQSENKILLVGISKPIYNKEKFINEISEPIEKFRMLWDMRFDGKPTRQYSPSLNVSDTKKHWATIKALNRRIVELNETEYGELRPVTELKGNITDQISAYLDKPIEWNLPEPIDEDKSFFTDGVRQNVSRQLGEYIEKNMIDKQNNLWSQAYNHKGTGSSKSRARDINLIYDQVAPLTVTSANWRELTNDIWYMVDNSVNSVYESKKNQSFERPIKPSYFIDDFVIKSNK